MRHVIIGTAGHIDHGKTALVRALTGIDTDRFEEEKRRGISIDLGFAHLSLGRDVRAGFVDVPGHERFVRNMLAGVHGIDLVLFVVAADESIKPQTREHFAICRLLGVRKGLIALTKADLVDADTLELVRLEVEEFVTGSFLDGAPVVAVSSVTGAGLEELKVQLAELAVLAAARDTARPARLPIDRAFTLRGIGTVVTGTLIAGTLRLEEEVEIHPDGLRARVRGLQVHGEAAAAAVAGQRTAVNLAGVELERLRRGQVLAPPGVLRPARRLDVRIELLPDAPPLKHRMPVHFHSGTAEVEAEVRLFEDHALAPGGGGVARLHLAEPVLVLPGDRFIVRMFSPVVTIAGGEILDIDPPERLRRAASRARLELLAENRLLTLVREIPGGLSVSELVTRTGWTEGEIAERTQPPLVRLEQPSPWLLDAEWVKAKQAICRERLAEFHRLQPLLPGMAAELLRSQVFPNIPMAIVDHCWASDPAVAVSGELLRLQSHKISLKTDEAEAIGKLEGVFRGAGLAVPALSEALRGSGIDPGRARNLLQILLREKKLVRVSMDLVYHAEAISLLKSELSQRRGRRFGVGEFKEWTGVSRKYAIPLLEYLDRERVTRRDGEQRLVL